MNSEAFERAFRELINSVNEANRSHALNYTGLMSALLTKGVISPEELEAGRQRAKQVVDQHFGPTPEQRQRDELAKFLYALTSRQTTSEQEGGR